MKEEFPAISVIIPTHNREAMLRRILDALGAQTYPTERMEVLLVADGCTDGTMQMLRHYTAPFCLRIFEQPNQGPSVARNYGAARASGQLLVFLDDDIEAAPHLIQAHANAHYGRPDHVVLGYLPPVFPAQSDFFYNSLRSWWEDVFFAMRQPGYRYSYHNLLSGNFSLEAELFARVGGFDPAFRCHEDYELGIRLIDAGALFSFAPEALGLHHDRTDLKRLLQRKYEEGRADVLIGLRHPKLRPVLSISRFSATQSRRTRILRLVAFLLPGAGDIVAACWRSVLRILEWVRIRTYWRELFELLLFYQYCRGLAKALGTQRALAGFLQGVPARDHEADVEIELDLREGLAAAERRLNEEHPAGVRLRYGRLPIGRIPPEIGAEKLRGGHLRLYLVTKLAWSFLQAITLESATEPDGPSTIHPELSDRSTEMIYADKSA
jgi:GT2 family glycosyltransferase